MTRLLESDICHLKANLTCFTNVQLGKFVRAILIREKKREAIMTMKLSEMRKALKVLSPSKIKIKEK